MLHDMHDGTVAQGDTWLSQQIPVLLASAAWTQQRSLPVITWDEDDNAPGNQVATLVIANGIPAGFRSAVAYNHYSIRILAGLLARLDLRPVDRATTELATALASRYRLRAADATHLATAVGTDRFITSNQRDFPATITEINVTYPADLT